MAEIQNEFWPGVDPETARKIIATQVPALASSVAANALPDPSNYYIPGAVSGMAATGGLLYELARAGLNKGVGTNLPPAPGFMERAGQHVGAMQDAVYNFLPHYQPTPEEASDYSRGVAMNQMVGNAIPIAPGSLLSGAPKALANTVKFFVPTTRGAATNAAVAGAAGPALAMTLDPNEAMANTAEQQPQQQPDSVASQLKISLPFGQAPQADSSPSVAQQLGINVPSVTSEATDQVPFHEEGSSPYTIGQALAGIGVFIAALGAAKVMHGLGAGVSAALRDERVANPTYAAKAADFNNAQIAAQGGAIANAEGGRTTAPIMGAGGAMGDNKINAGIEAAKTQVLDETAATRNYINLSSTDPIAAERLANSYSLAMDQSRWNAKIREFYITGLDKDSNIQVPSPKRLNDDILAVGRDKQKLLQLGIDSANEMDNRNRNIRRGVRGQDVRYDFPNARDEQLIAHTQIMLADPVLADIANRYWALGKGLVDIGEARGFFPPNEAKQLREQRPNYRPDVKMDGTIAHALGPRDITGTGAYQVGTTPWWAMDQHITQLLRQMELNDYILRPMTQHQMDFQAASPTSAQFLREVPNPYGTQHSLYATLSPSGAPSQEPIYQVRNPTGSKFYHSASPDWYNWMKGQNTNKVHTMVGALDRARRMVQAFTTGAPSMMTGRVFPLATHLPRVWLSTGINRPAGTVGSLSDLAMQRMTGGRLGQRLLPDPTSLPGYAYSFGRMQFDKFVNHLSDTFRPDNPHYIPQMLKTIIGPSQMQSISDALRRYYLGTVSHEMLSAGATNTGMDVLSRPPAFALGEPGGVKDVRSIGAELTPKLFMPPGVTGALKAHYINLTRAVEGIYSDLMDAGNQHFYRLNRFANPAIDPGKLAYETRQLVGNPATHGASAALQTITHTIPYSNIGIQATARTARALGEAPLGTTAALIGHLGSAALLSIYTMMRYGPAGLNYLSNMISTQSRSANIILGTGDRPETHTEISLPQHLRPLYAPLLDIVSKALNVASMMHDPISFDSVYQFMKDWFAEHIENSTGESTLHGLAGAAEFADFPAIASAASALGGGGQIHFDLEKLIQDYRNQGINLGSFTRPTGDDHPLPNHPVGDNLFEGTDAKKWSVILSSVFGMFGGVLDNAIGYNHTHHLLGNWLDTLGQVKDDAIQAVKDKNKTFALLWENPASESMRTPIVEMVSRRLENMKAAGGARNAELMEGTTGGKMPLPVAPQPSEDMAVPKDPAMRNLYLNVRAQSNWLHSQFVSQIDQIKKQMQAYNVEPMDPAQKREWMNNQKRVISDKYRVINQMIEDQNVKLSNMYGRRIDIGAPIDWKKGIDQFTPLN